MKKIVLLFTATLLFCSFSLQAQVSKCPPMNGQTQELIIQERANAVDFTGTFTDGTTVNLFTVLNAGNTVVLDMFYAA